MRATGYIWVLIFYVCDVRCVSLRPEVVLENGPDEATSQMNTIIYKTIHKYYCSIGNMTGESLILYGTNSWSFPVQDVNLTLSYPTANPDEIYRDWEDYLVTGFRVILYMDGGGSNGYLTNGGILRDTITLSFTSRQITMLRYQFWIYGIRKDLRPLLDTVYRICY